jgi:23S rRNA (cytosine1962-C5)-methyltransferase
VNGLPPFIVHEDEHVLIVNKPPGWNTHSPSAYAGEGVYEWLKNREERWAKLAIIHRLDKETSGLMIFSKTAEASRSLTEQFSKGVVKKEYILKSDKPAPRKKFTIKSHLKRVGQKYASERGGVSGVDAETEFEVLEEFVIARPKTGRTHQIRVHASENGFPILGDILYGGSPHERLCLHSQRIEFVHPVTGKATETGHSQFFDIPAWLLRREMITRDTNAFRWINGAADGFPGWHLDRLGEFLLSQGEGALTAKQMEFLEKWAGGRGVYHKMTTRHVRGTQPMEASPKHTLGPTSKGPFEVLENGVKFELNFAEGYSTGLFLDQRDNRRRLLRMHLKGAEILNTFAYTCGFSVCAALAGARVTSLDLSRKYLDWGRRNFLLNGIEPAEHDFVFGDVFDWVKRLAKKDRKFDVVLLDPPTFSQAKESGVFRAEKDYGKLVKLALQVLTPSGVLFCSSNASRWEPENFLAQIRTAISDEKRKMLSEQYFPQPPDFPISREEPAYLKTVWMRID